MPTNIHHDAMDSIATHESKYFNVKSPIERHALESAAKEKAASIQHKRAAYDDAIASMRAQQDAFAMAHANVIQERERANRIKTSAAAAAVAVAAAESAWDAAFKKSDGVITAELKKLRSDLRDARDLAEDYSGIREERTSAADELEIQALDAARTMDYTRRTALHLLAEIEMQESIAACAPQLARAFTLYALASLSDDPAVNNHTIQLEPLQAAMRFLENAVKSVDRNALELPADICEPANIAPLNWGEARSLASLNKRRRTAAARHQS